MVCVNLFNWFDTSTKNIAHSLASPFIITCTFAASYWRSASLSSIICRISEVEAAVGSSNYWAMHCIHAAFKFCEFSGYLSPLGISVSCIGHRRVYYHTCIQIYGIREKSLQSFCRNTMYHWLFFGAISVGPPLLYQWTTCHYHKDTHS